MRSAVFLATRRCVSQLVLLGIVGLLVSTSLADAPPRPPDTRRIQSQNQRFFALPQIAENRIQVLAAGEGEAPPTPLWHVDGVVSAVGLSDDGRFLVVGHPGENLLPLEHDPQVVILAIYREGTLTRQIRLSELVPDQSRLQRTVSHYHWGSYLGFGEPGSFLLQTADGVRYSVILESGELRRLEPE